MLQVGWHVGDSLLCTHFACAKGGLKAQQLLSVHIISQGQDILRWLFTPERAKARPDSIRSYQIQVVGTNYYPRSFRSLSDTKRK